MVIIRKFMQEVEHVIARDPAAHSRLEVILCYPSLYAVAIYRVSHWFWKRRARIPARMLSTFARWMTGIEIHPGATIGSGLFIDHGLGVVIGETAEIADNVTLYQGVTLGSVAPAINSVAQRGLKRHPTLGSGVIVGSGAQILGPIVIGDNACVGANSVVTRNVAPGTTVAGVPAKQINNDAGDAIHRPKEVVDAVLSADAGYFLSESDCHLVTSTPVGAPKPMAVSQV